MADTEAQTSYRLFVAITVPEEVRAKILKAQDRLRKLLPEQAARWARPEQFHLTLRFLGQVEAGRIEPLEAALRGACAGFGPLRLIASRIGFFPRPRSPRVVWVGVADEQQVLPAVWSAVQSATNAFTTEAPEDKFVGHITLARIKSIRPREAQAMAAQAEELAEAAFGQWTATGLEIIRSQLSPTGARYSTLKSIPFPGT